MTSHAKPLAETSFRGGARIGSFNATWPFARLTVSGDGLLLTCLKLYRFTAGDLVSLENYGLIPLVGRGIRIRHRRAELPGKIVFWYLGDRNDIWAALRAHGLAPPSA